MGGLAFFFNWVLDWVFPLMLGGIALWMLLGFFAALFYLDALGYIVLTVALYHPAFARFRRLARWALIALTVATIVAYFALIGGHYDAMGIGDKLIEVALIVLLVVEGRRDRTAPAAAADADRHGR